MLSMCFVLLVAVAASVEEEQHSPACGVLLFAPQHCPSTCQYHLRNVTEGTCSLQEPGTPRRPVAPVPSSQSYLHTRPGYYGQIAPTDRGANLLRDRHSPIGN